MYCIHSEHTEVLYYVSTIKQSRRQVSQKQENEEIWIEKYKWNNLKTSKTLKTG